jgi:fucose 4-O-acetylase-like acetyltransferase
MATLTSLADGSVVQFTRRFMGALVLDPATFEDVEADRHAGLQAAIVVLLACAGGGLAAVGSSSMNLATFVAGMAVTLGAWVVWALLITTIGTHLFPEPQTSSRYGELLRTMGFAAAPGLFLAFGAMSSVAPFAFAIASIWTIAATVLAVRQALDYRHLGRAVMVCVLAWLLTFGITAGAGILLTRPVS